MADVLFVSVAKSYRPEFTLAQLEPWVERAWVITPAKAAECDRVVAVSKGQPIAAWRLCGAFYVENETWGDGHRRTALSLSDPLPVQADYSPAPLLRRGVAAERRPEIEPLPPERDPKWFEDSDVVRGLMAA
jgi:hypothetical protein